MAQYSPGFPFKNGHFNSIYTSLLRKAPKVEFTRKRLPTPDDDFLDVDLISKGNKALAILCHGLEGNSDSQYIRGTSAILSENHWDIAAMNYRFCSGEINRQLRMYHSGASDDLDVLVQYFKPSYDQIVLIGFSLGGNLVLKYCGENRINSNTPITKAIAISAPTDLEAGSLNIGRKENYLYEWRFLKSLTTKIKAKAQQFPAQIDLGKLRLVKSLYDFDDLYTGPLHGFENAHHYYSTCSSKNFIGKIKIPTLIINALDDPFLPIECYPYAQVKENPFMTLSTPKWGGHVGFYQKAQRFCWNEVKLLEFLDQT